MSTKCTILWHKDWHFYFDYKDNSNHLTVKGKEVELPDSFMYRVSHLQTLHNVLHEHVVLRDPMTVQGITDNRYKEKEE